MQTVIKERYGHSISTVFGSEAEKTHFRAFDEDDDPVMLHLRLLDYRYIRFCFHPLRDRFVLSSNWKDPSWTDVKSIRVGLDGDERHQREQVFGMNLIDIQQKSVPQLLIDEVRVTATLAQWVRADNRQTFHPFYVFQIASLVLWSLDQYYYYAACIFLISVVSITTTLIDTRAVRTSALDAVQQLTNRQ